MTFRDWITESVERVSSDGVVDGGRESACEFLQGALRRIPNALVGTSIYDEEWDTCIILDGCRHDVYEEVCGPSESEFSVASASRGWLRRTFDDEVAEETVYVTANPHAPREVSDLPWRGYVEVLDDECADGGTIPADEVSDRAIAARAEHPDARLVVHYMQPHWPFVPDPVSGDGWVGSLDDHRSVWELLRDGEVERDRVWRAYRANLEYVFDEVCRVMAYLDDEEVLVTSDHGNLVGECGMYGHPGGVVHPSLRRVPWDVRESGSREKVEVPDVDLAEMVDEDVVRRRLSDLGYV